MRVRWFICAALSCAAAWGPAEQDRYLTGGAQPLPPESQDVLDRHAGRLQLGINTDWLAMSGINVEAYVEAVGTVANAVERGDLPGAVIYADRLVPNTMPAAIGWRMVDPHLVPLEYDTPFYHHTLTGALVTVPLALQAMQAGKLSPATTVGEAIPALAEAPVGAISVEQLLRHESGLPAKLPAGAATPANRRELGRALKTFQLSHEPGEQIVRSRYNFLLLGLVLESVQGKLLHELAQENLLGESTTLEYGQSMRRRMAAGAYSDYLGHMAWGESPDAWEHALGKNCGSAGLIASADGAHGLAVTLALMQPLTVDSEGNKLAAAGAAFLPGSGSDQAATTTMGYQFGKYGPMSFGWDDPVTGSALWILPEKNAFLLFLAAGQHPDGDASGAIAAREAALELLAEAIGPLEELPAAVDTAVQGKEPPAQAPPSPPEAVPVP